MHLGGPWTPPCHGLSFHGCSNPETLSPPTRRADCVSPEVSLAGCGAAQTKVHPPLREYAVGGKRRRNRTKREETSAHNLQFGGHLKTRKEKGDPLDWPGFGCAKEMCLNSMWNNTRSP